MSEPIKNIYIKFTSRTLSETSSDTLPQSSKEWVKNYSSKYDINGKQEWVEKYDLKENAIETPTSILTDHLNNVYVVGYLTNLIQEAESESYWVLGSIVLIKYNKDGYRQWVHTYEIDPIYYADAEPKGKIDLAIDKEGFIYVIATQTTKTFERNTRLVVIKNNSDGIQQWIRKSNGASAGIVLDKFGNVIVAGISSIIKYDHNGVKLWQVKVGESNIDYKITSVAIDSSENIIIAGNYVKNYIPTYFTIKHNHKGEKIFETEHKLLNNQYFLKPCLKVDSKNNIYLSGGYSGNNDSLVYIIIKHDKMGKHQWTTKYNGTGRYEFFWDYTIHFVIDTLGRVTLINQISQSVALETYIYQLFYQDHLYLKAM